MSELGKEVRVRVFIAGKVQNVGFRNATRARAERFSVSGFVKNLPNGGIEALFQGEAKAVDRMLEFCKMGPLGAKVTEVKIQWEEYKDEYKDFKVVN